MSWLCVGAFIPDAAVFEEHGRQAIDLMTPHQKRVESYVGGVRNCKYRSALDLTLIVSFLPPGLEAILRWEHQDGGPEPRLCLESPGSVFSEISRRKNSEIKHNKRSPRLIERPCGQLIHLSSRDDGHCHFA